MTSSLEVLGTFLGVVVALFLLLIGIGAVVSRLHNYLLDRSFTAWKRNYVRAAREDEDRERGNVR